MVPCFSLSIRSICLSVNLSIYLSIYLSKNGFERTAEEATLKKGQARKRGDDLNTENKFQEKGNSSLR